jgi:hypothetical protein
MPARRQRSTSVSSPHDAYAQSVFRELPQARAFSCAYLPPDVQALCDWPTLRLERGSFVSDELRRSFTDLRFTIRFIGDPVLRRLRLLFEHKFRVVSTTPRQLLRYISREMEETSTNQPLPAILTVVLLQSGTWSGSHTLSSEYDLPDAVRGALTPYLLDFRMVMVELASLDESGLKGTVAGRFALALLKAVGEGRPMGWRDFHSILSDVCRKLRPERLARELRRAVYYLLSVTKKGQEAEVRAAVESMPDQFLPVKEKVMTLLEHLRKQGEKRGEKRGRVAILIQLLSAAFPEFSAADADRVRKLPAGLLAELTDAIAHRRSWDEIAEILARNGR